MRAVSISIEEFFPRFGWKRRTVAADTEKTAFTRGHRLRRRRDVRFVRIIVVEDGHTSKYTLKTRFPKVDKELLNVSSHV